MLSYETMQSQVQFSKRQIKCNHEQKRGPIMLGSAQCLVEETVGIYDNLTDYRSLYTKNQVRDVQKIIKCVYFPFVFRLQKTDTTIAGNVKL
jgi:hypothetical protein